MVYFTLFLDVFQVLRTKKQENSAIQAEARYQERNFRLRLRL